MKIRSNGKLLITGEYAVLDGALSLAIPTKYGQTLDVDYMDSEESIIYWESYDYNLKLWFKSQINYKTFEVLFSSEEDISNQLIKIFIQIRDLNPSFFSCKTGIINVKTVLEFPNNWGLGSSSTLINNLAIWTNVNPYDLLDKTFGGSGYDIASANTQNPIFYQLLNNDRKILNVEINPKITENIYFLHLNVKQNSREGIKLYRNIPKDKNLIDSISNISQLIPKSEKLDDLEKLLQEHENLISHFLSIPPVKQRLFSDYSQGIIKSLGAWGGDFVLVTSKNNPKKYFSDKGYDTLLSYKDMIL